MSDTQPEEKVCPMCKGSGENPYPLGSTLACPTCNGTGKVPMSHDVSLTTDKPTSLEGGELKNVLAEFRRLHDGQVKAQAYEYAITELEKLLAQSYKQGQRDELERFYRWVENHYNSAALITALSERLVELNQGEESGE